MTFKKYPKIHRLGKEETDGILIGTVEVQEKIDGANTSIWLDKRGELTCGSRSRELTEGFNGFVDFVKSNEAIKKCLEDNPTFRLYGEWLVRHTISYNETAYKNFYLFDITKVKDGEEAEEFLPLGEVYDIASKYGIPTPHHFGTFDNPTSDDLQQFAGQSVLGDKGEGKRDWESFFNEIPYDTPRWNVIDQVFDLEAEGYEIVFVTARPDNYKRATVQWLEKTLQYYPKETTLIMRRAGDRRDDTEVKKEMYETYFKDKYPIKVVFDDRPSVIRMWKEQGLDVVDVGEGIEF